MIEKAINALLKAVPGRTPIGYWMIGKGIIIKIAPTSTEEDYHEELLFYVEGNKVKITNPMEHPVIINKPMIKL